VQCAVFRVNELKETSLENHEGFHSFGHLPFAS
jgi:hypothetical protein